MAGDLPHRSRPVRLNGPARGPLRAARAPEALFVVSAVAQYLGALIAIGLFDRVSPATVAWLRVTGAAVVLAAVSPGFHRGWTRAQFAAAALFGCATAAMNLFFYLAVARMDLGKGVAIEFIGPILVAALATRSTRNAAALAAAVVGVAILGGTEIDDNALGLVFIGLASAMWAAYIVIGARVARLDRGVAGLGVGLGVGAVALAPIGLPGSAPVWVAPTLLFAALATGVLSNAVGYGIDQVVLRRVPVRRFSVMLALLPATAVLMGWVGLGQRPATVEWLGIALVVLALGVQERDRIAGDRGVGDREVSG